MSDGIKYLIQYQNEWYRCYDSLDSDTLLIANFDTVIKVFESHCSVIKDRYYGQTGKTTSYDLLRMKLFATGMSITDLPKFTKYNNRNYKSTVIGYKDNGDLFEYPMPTETS